MLGLRQPVVLREGQPAPILCGKSAPQHVHKHTHAKTSCKVLYKNTKTKSRKVSPPLWCAAIVFCFVLHNNKNTNKRKVFRLPTPMLSTTFKFSKMKNNSATGLQRAPPLYLKQPLLLLSFRCGPCWGERVNIATSFTTHNRPSPTAIIVINRGNKSIL